MKKKTRLMSAIMLSVYLTFCSFFTLTVQAATVNLHFGSEEYEYSYNESFLIGVYIESDEDIADYEVLLSYDDRYMSYLNGAEDGGDGIVRLYGTLNDHYKKYLISFRGEAGGDTNVEIVSATINTNDVEGIGIDAYPTAPVHLSPNPNAYLESIEIDGQVIDEFESDTFNYDLRIPYTDNELSVETVGNENVTAVISNTTLVTGDNIVFIEAIGNNDARNIYRLNVYMEEQLLDEVTENEASAIDAIEVEESFDEATNGQNINSEDVLPLENEVNRSSSNELMVSLFGGRIEFPLLPALLILLGILILLFFVILHIAYLVDRGKRRRKKRRKKKIQRQQQSSIHKEVGEKPIRCITEFEEAEKYGIEWVSLNDDDLEEVEFLIEDEQQLVEDEELLSEEELLGDDEASPNENDDQSCENEEPVISVKNVTMKFKISTSDASGLKEFIIQKLKKKVTYCEFIALNDVSFDVYKGEVVGIIGTNGSGKSTLLRIVSGALNPTSGQVEVDRRKVQLLTLGTGFDMELTARENIYLNGAIIGYSKQFLDEHFDEIIEFAELQDFVDEKVKNFSSGMVSRLGFAIATAGDAAEILILDEVLSVGDEFFRKKSLARIKNMIHSGATVLLVSHAMNTITENCSKAVWIEKGILKMVGDVNTVCSEYQGMGNKR